MGIELCVAKAMINRTPYHRPIGGISLASIKRCRKTLYSVPSSDRQRDWVLNCSGIRSVGPLKQGAKRESVEGVLEHERWSQRRRRDKRPSDRSRRPRNMQQQGWGDKPQLFNLKVQQSPRHQQGRTPDGRT
ncbi:hypothetical protein BO79DRAFT_223535 [Aspergillus costaricaensis CBS 115574]|uniref:Uncharacterized protein n=1 Tax=Aspergillus costaricaensis CBS 115574 TaxID=1448317 RepID=A0ACD1IWZ1_9EURO|nr:hypothetical protein BO79DRAFT_223535 [Aspergillus costaricaensis CBS 115574]RAK94470.1 hypothetical protein BO79DRAFT_223535 [Aspergillus costaricaensis CBS 115574]